MNKQPLVSIIIPTYNRADLIGETLDSVLAQTYTNWECLIVDDGSTDTTEEVVSAYVKKDTRFQYYHRPHDRPKGANACRNYGFEKSKGAYIQWLDSDDLISENKLERQVIAIQGESSAIAVCNWGYFVDSVADTKDMPEPFDRFTNPLIFLNYLYSRIGFFPIHAYLIPRGLQIKSGLWNEYLKINQDAEMIIRVICNSNNFLFSKEVKVFYRTSGDFNRTSSLNDENIHDYLMSWKLIQDYLTNRFKNQSIEEFERHKIKIINRIPKEHLHLIRNEEGFLKKALRKQRNESFKNKLIGWSKLKGSFKK